MQQSFFEYFFNVTEFSRIMYNEIVTLSELSKIYLHRKTIFIYVLQILIYRHKEMLVARYTILKGTDMK